MNGTGAERIRLLYNGKLLLLWGRETWEYLMCGESRSSKPFVVAVKFSAGMASFL